MTNPFSYDGKTVVVTGAATGVGAALLDVLAELGAEHVTVLDVKPPTGPHARYLEVNLADQGAIDAAAADIAGPVHALFNNAGVADTSPPRTVIAVNYLALRHLSESLLDRIPEGGAIVNTASTAGGQWATHVEQINELLDIADWGETLDWTDAHLGSLGVPPYFFSKELVQVHTMRSSRPTIRRGVRTNSVCPSPIDTPLLDDFRKTMTDKIIDWNVSETNGRLVTAREVATVLAFLGSDAAAYVNGVNLLVDAGFTAAMTTGQVDFFGTRVSDAVTNANRLFDLTGKVAIVTGSTKGIGRAMASGLAQAGATVVVSSRKQELCDQVASEIAAESGATTLGLACHVGDWDAIPAFVGTVHERFGRIDVVVNNAGITPSRLTVSDITRDVWQKIFSVNLEGPLRMGQCVAPVIRDHGGGSIVNIASMAAYSGGPGVCAYGASKAALVNLTKSMAQEWVSWNVRVNVLSPGPFVSEMVEGAERNAPGFKDMIANGTLMKRVADPTEIVGPVLYLASDASSFVTGDDISVSGGMQK